MDIANFAGPPAFPFEERDAVIQMRRQRLAQLMREQSSFQNLPGQMVSGHFVAPSWAQNLNNVVGPAMDRRIIEAERQGITQDVGRYAADDRRAALEHAMNAPGMQGPASPETEAAWQQQGLAIPSRKALMEKLIEDRMVNEPIRQEARAERKTAREDASADRAAGRAEALAARLEELKVRLEDRALDRASREQMAKEQRELQRQLAEMNNLTRRDLIAAQIEARTAAASKPKAMSDKARADLDAADGMQEALDAGISALEKASGKGLGWMAGVAQNALPGGSSVVNAVRDKGTNEAVQQITYVTDEIRHGRFGSALTATEKASAGQYLPTEHDSKEQMLAKAKGIRKLVELNNRRLRAKDEGSGGGATGSWDEPAAGPKVRKFNPATGRLE